MRRCLIINTMRMSCKIETAGTLLMLIEGEAERLAGCFLGKEGTSYELADACAEGTE